VLTGTSSVDGQVTVVSFTVDGDSTTYTAGATATITGKGTLTINSDGGYTFAPAANYNGPVPVVTYTVTDGSGVGDTSTLTISVTAVEDEPVANAGPDQPVREKTLVTLDGSASSDAEDATLTYLWTQTGGEQVTLSNSAAVKPTFTAPGVGDAGIVLTFSLKVTDSAGGESTDTVSVQVNDYVIPCDVNDNGIVDLADTVILLRIMSRLPLNPDVPIALKADVNGDHLLGMAEVICALQHAAGLRPAP
jgi:hypothetical protein